MPLKPNAHVVDAEIRSKIFDILNVSNIPNFSKVNDRQWGTVIEDSTGTPRYVRVGVIVAKVDETFSAQEMMDMEHNEYLLAQRNKEKIAKERAKKAEEDKIKRAKKAAEKAEKEKE